MPRSGIAELYCFFYFWFFEDLPYLFSEWLYQFTLPPTVHKDFFSSHPYQLLLFVAFLIIAILTGMRWYCGFDFHFPENYWLLLIHLFMYFLAICVSLENVYLEFLNVCSNFDFTLFTAYCKEMWFILMYWLWILQLCWAHLLGVGDFCRYLDIST